MYGMSYLSSCYYPDPRWPVEIRWSVDFDDDDFPPPAPGAEPIRPDESLGTQRNESSTRGQMGH